jgi:hypothetical protein
VIVEIYYCYYYCSYLIYLNFNVALNAVEASALKKAKEERRRLSDSHRNPKQRQGDILEGTNRGSVYRVRISLVRIVDFNLFYKDL